MSQATRATRERLTGDVTSKPAPSRDSIYKLLANRRRRYVIHYLKQQERTVTLGTLAEQVGAWEYDESPAQLTADERKAVYTALQQRHLPKMAGVGIVEFDKRAGTVSPTAALDDIDIYAEVVGRGDFPWNQYYLALSTGTVALLLAVWADIPPLIALPDIAWGLFAAVSFAVSAAAHAAVTREMKLGTPERPPEVRS